MNLRSGKQYEIKCRCLKWFPNPKFNNQCSDCFRENDPEGWKIFMKDNWCPATHIGNNELDNFIEMKRINFRGSQWKMLLNSMDEIGAIASLLNYIKKKINTSRENAFGITAKEGAELYARFREVHGDIYGTKGAGQNSDWRWQHLFGGLIFDKWNITTDGNGPIAYCYYGNFGVRPRGYIHHTLYSAPSPWISNDKKRREFWLRSLPDGFSGFIN